MRLSASDLACRRGGRDVFAGVNFSVESGESLTVRGRNGAGKSSLLRMIVGLVRIAAGRLDLAGGDAELTIGEQAHYLGHLDALKPALTVGENLRFWSRFFGTARRRPATAWHGRAGRAHRPARRLPFRRPAAAAFDRPASRREAPGVAPRRADQHARRRGTRATRRHHARTPRRRRHHRRGDARRARARRRQGVVSRSSQDAARRGRSLPA